MNYKKTIKNFLIEVKKFSNEITITDTETGKLLGSEKFNDHIQAIGYAKRLYASCK